MAPRRRRDQQRVARKDRHGMDPVKAGVILLVVLGLICWFGFSKDIPFKHGPILKAVVSDAVAIRPTSPVRIAGVDVGKVKKVEPYNKDGHEGRASVVTMELNGEAPAIHQDATIKIRPRIFLEGNWFVDLQPGTPASPKLASGDTLPITQASAPVQFDQLLTMLQSDTRADLKSLLDGLGTALTYKPTAADDADQDPMVHGKTAAEALHMSMRDAAPALRQATLVNQAMLGENSGDLGRLIRSTARVTGALADNDRELQSLVRNLNGAMGAFAAERTNLSRSVRQLGPTVLHARQAFEAVDSALPNTRALALELVPGMRETPATIDAAYPWIDQVRALVSGKELGGTVRQLQPATRSLAKLGDENLRAMPEASRLGRCVSNWLIPTFNIKVDDGNLSTGVENYKEFFYAATGFNGEGQNFDGNGRYVRFQLGGGGYAWATGPHGPSGGTNAVFRRWARTNKPPLGTRPAYSGKKPPYVADKACKDQPLPNVNGKAAGPADGAGPGGVPAHPYVSQLPVSENGADGGTGAPATATGGDLTARLADRLNPFSELKGDAR